MKLTPLDIRHREFKRGMRGYVDAEVDEFLDQVADEFERLFKENIDLNDRVEALQEQINHYRTLEDTLQKTLITAQQSAEEVKSSAQKEAGLILRDADLRARDMVGDAERKSRDMLNDSYASKQEVEKQIVLLRNTESDFRFKFRQMLEGFLKQISGGDESARERADEFARQAEQLKAALEAERSPKPAAPQAVPPARAEPAAAVRHWWEPSPEEEEAAKAETAGPGESGQPLARSGQPSSPAAPLAAGEPPRADDAQSQTAADAGEDTEALDEDEPDAFDEDEATRETSPVSREASEHVDPHGDLMADVDDRVGDDDFKW